MTFLVKSCETAADYAAARSLFEEYAAGLGFSLCFQGFDREITMLPAMYGPPGGALLIAVGPEDGEPRGCVGVRRFSDDTCEMKRLYVRDQFKGKGIGRQLAEEALVAGRRLGFRRMVLDTVPSMQAAQSLYHSLGFREIPAYYDGPCGALYMEKVL
jgi:ribosomal protein S18 acetylase RimI-like enzyme